MRTRHVLMLAVLLGSLAAASVLIAADQSPQISNPDKVLVTDGHVVHDVGSLENNVTNFGLIGSWPGVSTPFSSAPSARWGGIDYLFAAGAWFGGTGQANNQVCGSEDEPATCLNANESLTDDHCHRPKSAHNQNTSHDEDRCGTKALFNRSLTLGAKKEHMSADRARFNKTEEPKAERN